jgi:hypothetical protein
MWLRVVAWYFKIGGFVVALFAVIALLGFIFGEPPSPPRAM